MLRKFNLQAVTWQNLIPLAQVIEKYIISKSPIVPGLTWPTSPFVATFIQKDPSEKYNLS